MNGTSASAPKWHGKGAVEVLTPTIPGRENYLQECEASVRAQTARVLTRQFVEVDETGAGCSVTINRAAAKAKQFRTPSQKWYLPLADDDLLLPGGVAELLAASDDADVVYAPPLVTGNEDRWWFFQAPPCIPAVALISIELWDELGGYDETLKHEEDRDMWTKALDLGARFVRVDAPVWVYRQHAGNKSFNKAAA